MSPIAKIDHTGAEVATASAAPAATDDKPVSLSPRNPRSGTNDDSVSITTQEELSALCGASRAAQPAWSSGGIAHRQERMQKLKEALTEAKQRLVDALIADTGSAA